MECNNKYYQIADGASKERFVVSVILKTAAVVNNEEQPPKHIASTDGLVIRELVGSETGAGKVITDYEFDEGDGKLTIERSNYPADTATFIIRGCVGNANFDATLVVRLNSDNTDVDFPDYVVKYISDGEGGEDFKSDEYYDADGRLVLVRESDGSTTIYDEHENPIMRRLADGTTKIFDAYQGDRLTIDAMGNIHFAELALIAQQVVSNTEAIQGIAATGGASVSSAVLFPNGNNLDVEMAKKTEKVRVDITPADDTYEFKLHGDSAPLNFAQLNAMLQQSPNFVVFVHGNREHRCVRIDSDGSYQYMEFVSPIIDGVNAKIQSFLVSSVNGVEFYGKVKRTDIICENKTDTDALRAKVSDLSAEIDNLELSIDGHKIIVNKSDFVSGKYYRADHSEGNNPDSRLSTNPIKVIKGDIFDYTIVNTDTVYRIVAYDVSLDILWDKSQIGGSNVGQYTVPEGVAYITFTSQTNQLSDIKVTHSNAIEGTKVSDSLKSIIGSDGMSISKSSLANGISFDSYPKHNKRGDNISFSCDVTTFDGIEIQFGRNSIRSKWIQIKQSVVEFYAQYEPSGPSAKIGEVNHGLSIEKFLHINVEVLSDFKLRLHISTFGGYFEYIYEGWDKDCHGTRKIVNLNSNLSNCKASITSPYYRKQIWIFGASYETPQDTQRWLYYMMQKGYDSYYINALNGRDSVGSYDELVKALQFGTPKYLYWTAFGNDSSSQMLSNYIDMVKELGEQKGFEVILTKRPSTPVLDNSAKIAVIENSGCRYVDIESAMIDKSVGSNVWYDGFLAADNVHPTARGAEVMSDRILTDFPEFMQY